MYDSPQFVTSVVSGASSESPDTESSWLSESWRLTAFAADPALAFGDASWAQLVGQQPDTTTSNPRLGARQEMGSFADGILLLSVQPGRLDWLYSASPPPEDASP